MEWDLYRAGACGQVAQHTNYRSQQPDEGSRVTLLEYFVGWDLQECVQETGRVEDTVQHLVGGQGEEDPEEMDGRPPAKVSNNVLNKSVEGLSLEVAMGQQVVQHLVAQLLDVLYVRGGRVEEVVEELLVQKNLVRLLVPGERQVDQHRAGQLTQLRVWAGDVSNEVGTSKPRYLNQLEVVSGEVGQTVQRENLLITILP